MRRSSLPALSLSLVAAALLLGAVSAVEIRSKTQTLAQTESQAELEVSARLFEEATVDALDHALARHSHVVRALTEANPLPSMSVADATRFFYSIDRDKEGLDKKEFAAFFADKAGMTKEQIEEFWSKLDKNENGLVTLTEWMEFFFPGGNASPATTGEREYALKMHDAEVSFDVTKNAGAHHVDPFNQFQITKTTKLIVRRGQPFFLTVTVPAANATEDQAREIFFDLGSFTAKNVGKGSLSVSKWGTRFIGFNDSAASVSTSSSAARKAMMFQVNVPFNAPIGRYMVKISGPMLQHRELGSVLVLFNPWSSLDEVYMPEKNLLEEYVMEDDTHIYTGDVVDVALKGIHQMGWNLHQYEVLDTVLQLLTDNVPAASLAYPAKVARALTWILNTAENPNGVLTGRWDGVYTDGAKPSSWTGSRAIFNQFRDTGKAVKYGQCWVFAALLTSALRSIGVPSRVVTTFRSAHDTPPYDLVIDRTVGESVWNFHVWVDGWFHRRDLNTTFIAKKDRACWNALDATPQEKSDGKYQMGPAALPLIQSNVTNAPFDTMFVIGEANARVWLGQGTYKAGNDYSDMDFDHQDVGQFISTNRPGCNHSPQSSNCREDITHQYKFPNESFSRFALKKLHAFEASINPEHPVLGESFVVTSKRSGLMIQKPVWVNVSLTADMITYTGKFLANVKTLVGTCRLHPDPKHKDNTCKDTAGGWRMNVAVQDYLKYLPRTTHFRIVMRIKEYYASSSFKVYGRHHSFKEYVFEKQFTLNLPSVAVSITPPHVEAGRPFQAVVSFLNPLPVALTNITLTLDAPDYDKVAKFDKGSIPARSAASPKKAELVTEQMTASLPGIWPLAVTVTCNQFQGLRGHAHVNVQPNHKQLE